MSVSYQTDLYAAQQFLAFDTSITAAVQRERFAVALRELGEGRLTAATEAAVLVAQTVLKGAL